MKQVLARMAMLVVVAGVTGGFTAPSGSERGGGAGVTTAEARAISDSSAATARIQDLRARFVVPVTPAGSPGFMHAMPTVTTMRSALGASVATGFEQQGAAVRAVIPAEARQGTKRTASVVLPVHADHPVRVEDDTSHVAVSFTLRGASDAAVTTAGGIAMYPGALPGADVLHRVHAEGTEDYVVFEQRPAKEELAYDVDVSRVAGLRLVSNTLEFLD